MTSSFADMGRHATSAAVLVAALALGSSCTRVKVEDTTAEFTRASDFCGAAGEDSHRSQNTAATRTMDTYVVQVMELQNVSTAGGDTAACDKCAATGEGCSVILQQCYCGGPTTASPKQLQMTMSGTRLGALDYGDLYCLRVVAIDRSSLQGDPPYACQCADAWTTPSLAPDKVRLCAVSNPYAASPLDFQLEVRCPSDGAVFSSCIGAQ